jgi:hypothetical protein
MVYGGHKMNEILKARRKIQKAKKEAALAKQEPVNQITLEFLREEIKNLERGASALYTRAGETGDQDIWDLAKSQTAEIVMCMRLIQYIKGLNYEEYNYQVREGKL